jgi:hypothetical protein
LSIQYNLSHLGEDGWGLLSRHSRYKKDYFN